MPQFYKSKVGCVPNWEAICITTVQRCYGKFQGELDDDNVSEQIRHAKYTLGDARESIFQPYALRSGGIHQQTRPTLHHTDCRSLTDLSEKHCKSSTAHQHRLFKT